MATRKKPAAPTTRRVHLSVPEADVSVIAWLDAQNSVSASIREIIKESIRRDGIIDPCCMPVEQAPRRGRPPTESEAEAPSARQGARQGAARPASAQDASERPGALVGAPEPVPEPVAPVAAAALAAPAALATPADESSAFSMDDDFDMEDLMRSGR